MLGLREPMKQGSGWGAVWDALEAAREALTCPECISAERFKPPHVLGHISRMMNPGLFI